MRTHVESKGSVVPFGVEEAVAMESEEQPSADAGPSNKGEGQPSAGAGKASGKGWGTGSVAREWSAWRATTWAVAAASGAAASSSD